MAGSDDSTPASGGDGAATPSPSAAATDRVTIYDVAEAAGVSASTVSRTFSRPGRVNATTAARIRRIAADLGYRTTAVTASIPQGSTRLLALVVSDVTNPVFFSIIRGASTAAAKAGYTLVLVDGQESAERERAALDRALPMVEGVVMAASRMPGSSLAMVAKVRPTVVLNRGVVDLTSVVVDNPRGMRRVAEHLGQLGHRGITWVAGPRASWADGMRWRALQEAALDLDLEVRRVGPYEPTLSGGRRAGAELAAQPPTAVAAYNDLLAIGAIRGLAEHGVGVPEDVSVVGFDDTIAAAMVSPALTTVGSPLQALGMAGVDLVLDLLQGGRASIGKPTVLPVRLVERDSTGPPRDGR